MEYVGRFGKHFKQNGLMNNVGVIGDGKWAKIIIPKISKLSNVKFIINSKINYKILNLKKISWIFVLTNNETHYEIVKYFLNKKKNVFCEKPLSNYYSQVIELYKLAKKKKVKLYTNDVEFFKMKRCDFMTFPHSFFSFFPLSPFFLFSPYFLVFIFCLDVIPPVGP